MKNMKITLPKKLITKLQEVIESLQNSNDDNEFNSTIRFNRPLIINMEHLLIDISTTSISSNYSTFSGTFIDVSRNFIWKE